MNSTTPQRPQRRQRRTISTSGNVPSSLPAVHSAGSLWSVGSPRASPVHSQQRRSPPASQPQPSRRQPAPLHRQHSVSCATPPNVQSARRTPLRMTAGPLFAGSKFMDSPAPEKVPMPPMAWLGAAKRDGSGVSPTPSAMSLGSSASTESSASLDAASVASSDDLDSLAGPRPLRITPLQLIAMVAAN
ncbi:hypothetical protein M3Y99_00799700 [Aphelenchoides fujianensis]|nr:hypothetical protein M3Y99_00799700 [Aphelenchoides fujianensis]